MDNAEFNTVFPLERCEISDQSFSNKQELFRYILKQCWKNSLHTNDTQHEKEKDTIFQALVNRETLLTTGVGKGLAIPHCGIDFLHDSYGYLLYLKKKMDYDSIDEKKVFFVCMLLIPQRHYQLETRVLTSLCNLFTSKKNINQIQKLTTTEMLHKFFSQKMITNKKKSWFGFAA